MTVKVKLLSDEAKLPVFKKHGDAGADLESIEDTIIKAHETKAIGTGIVLEIPVGYEGQIRSRSGLALQGLFVLNAPGTIDSGYRGEVKVILHNINNSDFVVCKGDRIAQLVVHEVCPTSFEIVSSVSQTERGEDGFGSTGVKDN